MHASNLWILTTSWVCQNLRQIISICCLCHPLYNFLYWKKDYKLRRQLNRQHIFVTCWIPIWLLLHRRQEICHRWLPKFFSLNSNTTSPYTSYFFLATDVFPSINPLSKMFTKIFFLPKPLHIDHSHGNRCLKTVTCTSSHGFRNSVPRDDKYYPQSNWQFPQYIWICKRALLLPIVCLLTSHLKQQ